MMRQLAFVLAVALGSGALIGAARADVVITIDKSQQQMSVAVDGATRYTWPVSTARAGYTTPNGTYRPHAMYRSWFSRKYYNSPMPHSIFFHGGYAIHGSYEISRLGGPASHGCVRLHPSNAATLFSLVRSEGMNRTRIVVTGAGATHYAHAHAREHQVDYTPQRPAFGASGGYYGGYGGYPAAHGPAPWWPNR